MVDVHYTRGDSDFLEPSAGDRRFWPVGIRPDQQRAIKEAECNDSSARYFRHYNGRQSKSEERLYDAAFQRGWDRRSRHELGEYEQQLAAAIAATDAAYAERNQVVAALAKCFPAGTLPHDIEGERPGSWRLVYIDLPTGQASWHYSAREKELFAHLPAYGGAYDGHSTEEKYRRLEAFHRGWWVRYEVNGRDYTATVAGMPSPRVARRGWPLLRSPLAVALLSGMRWYRRFYGGRWEQHYFDGGDVLIWLSVEPGMEWPHHVPTGARGTPVVEEYDLPGGGHEQ